MTDSGPLAGARQVDADTYTAWVGRCARLTAWEQTGDPRREAHADTYWVWDGPAIGARVRHQRHGEGVVTSIGSQDWVFVKFPQFIASRMCHVAFLEEL